MLWLGDNVYMRKGDHGDSSRVFGRWHYERAFPSLRPLLASAHNLAILDDHDFGPNDCTGDYCYKNLNVQAHIAFWANRQFGLDTLAGTMGYEQYGDVDFFLTDNRFHRRPHTDSAACQFGKSQLNWLLNALAASSASFKFVLIGNQTLNSARTERISMNGNFVNLYPQEWREMIEGIRERQVQNVIFVTGDRHIAEVAVLDTAGYPVMYDFTFSPLSSPGMKGFFRREGNTRRVPGSYYGHKSFGVLEITGPAGNRQLRGQIVNRRGKTVFEILIPQRPTARN
jgi:alkaline phosphatase D